MAKGQKKNFRRKLKRFEIRNDGESGDWPHGKVLWIKIFLKTGEVKETKLYVPWWHKEQILEKFHGDNGKGAHFGRNRLHLAISVDYYGITEADCLKYIQKCPGCKVIIVYSN